MLLFIIEAIGPKLRELIDTVISQLSGSARQFYEREFEFFNKITGVSGEIRSFPKGIERKNACLKSLSKISVTRGSYQYTQVSYWRKEKLAFCPFM